ncbi:class A beta-lactamase-related serine hydrolase [Patescibacteria group bacterium]|nr:class A beta-lactamase-related serine hydrolase [Patescibacteria group bacterium]MCG2702164.1 class A beta-lactamase-related serine hydrolase [Candidatus Parcubacteria bacterium]MBU4265352.1 class A beta-lactamase-related serine hydrolase [Patescibacteria group bacterium]MBU4390792.1 class A beta-lactamase-related serine hydrolase [Patescibacteria group bacterium]MBU4396651.1 class A beta-lactamase-related serine hydrolase [Patescibacteria group bacterium]
MKKFHIFVTGLFGFILGCIVTLCLIKTNKTDVCSKARLEKRETGYQYINPLLECEYTDKIGATEQTILQKNIKKILQQYSDIEFGIYYRDLTNGPWFGIDEDVPFAPQSLLKLPVALAYYKLAENNPQIINKKIAYNKPLDKTNTDDALELNQEYSVEYLIHRMLVLSDNTAFNLLVMNLPSDYIQKVHQDLGITFPDESTPEDFITVKTYASIFRVLYNSSYLPRKSSEIILQLLAQSEFSEGLVSGVPNEITVAHKFGILSSDSPTTKNQLHDCAIVYHPQKPYILCVMSKGKDRNKLIDAMQNISKNVFDEINKE